MLVPPPFRLVLSKSSRARARSVTGNWAGPVGRNGQSAHLRHDLPLGLHRGAAATIASNYHAAPPALLLHNCPTEPEACQRHRGPHGIVGIDIAGPRRAMLPRL